MISLKSWQAQNSNLQQSSCSWVLGLQVCHQAWLLLYFRSLVWTNIMFTHHFTCMNSAGGPSIRQFHFLFVFNFWTSYHKYFLTLGGWIHKYGGLNVLIQALMWMNCMTLGAQSQAYWHICEIQRSGVKKENWEFQTRSWRKVIMSIMWGGVLNSDPLQELCTFFTPESSV